LPGGGLTCYRRVFFSINDRYEDIMKYTDREIVAGTTVSVGRRVQRRRTPEGVVERPAKTYSAEYLDVDGARRIESLGVTTKREARKKALEIQARLDDGAARPRRGRVSVAELIERYDAFCESKGLAPKSLAKYRAELAKIKEFCEEAGVKAADRFDERAFHRYGAWLREAKHKQGRAYAPKSVHTSLTVCKQLFNWGWRSRLLAELPIAGVKLPRGRARPQPCYTSEQVEAMIERSEGTTRAAIVILAFTGLRIGELEQLRWEDVRLDLGELGKLHIRRGGSGETTKDKEARLVPIPPRVREVLESLPRPSPLVLPELKQRTLLGQVKRLCRELGYDPRLKVHSFRHHFASMVANSSVPYRLVLEWMGHSSSDVLDLYYHLHDSLSDAAMMELVQSAGRAR